jgi:FAD-dependent urate hydroxylase
VPIEVTGSSRILTLLGPGGFVGLQPAGEGLLQWYFSVPPTAGSALAAGAGTPLTMLRQRFASYADPVPRVLEAITGGDLTAWPHHTHPVPTVWGAGRLTLVGDAAHTMPPSMAQGVNQTLEDAHALTRALDPARIGAGDPAPALRRYEATRAKQVSRIARMSSTELSTTYRPATQLLWRAMPQTLGTALYRNLIERSSSVLDDPAPAGLPQPPDARGDGPAPRPAT